MAVSRKWVGLSLVVLVMLFVGAMGTARKHQIPETRYVSLSTIFILSVCEICYHRSRASSLADFRVCLIIWIFLGLDSKY